MITTFPKPYKIRSDGAVLIPPEALALLRWTPGDDKFLIIDQNNMTLTLTDKPSKNISNA